MSKTDGRQKSIKDRLTYAYLRRIKKWMFCPACSEGKMSINKKSTIWACEDCRYKLSVDEFEDDYVFWFCDECQEYLNIQEGFDRHANKHICRNCGYENDTTFDNIKGVCVDCGKFLPDRDATLCVDCRQARIQKAKQGVANVAKVAGVAVLAGLTYVAAQADEGDSEYLLSDCSDDYDGTESDFDYVSDSWLELATEEELRNTEENMRLKLATLDYDSDEYLQLDLKRLSIVDSICCRFPVKLPHREHGWYLPNDD